MHKKLHEKVSTNEEGIVALHDLGCSAALSCAGFRVASLDKTNPNKVKFIFHKKSDTGVDIEQVMRDYWNFNLQLDGQTFFNHIRRLKNEIYSSN